MVVVAALARAVVPVLAHLQGHDAWWGQESGGGRRGNVVGEGAVGGEEADVGLGVVREDAVEDAAAPRVLAQRVDEEALPTVAAVREVPATKDPCHKGVEEGERYVQSLVGWT